MGLFKSEVAKMEENVNSHYTFSEMTTKDIDAKCKRLSEQISTTVQNREFIEQVEKQNNFKSMIESELDMIQTHVRNAKDLQGELLKKFELAIQAGDPGQQQLE